MWETTIEEGGAIQTSREVVFLFHTERGEDKEKVLIEKYILSKSIFLKLPSRLIFVNGFRSPMAIAKL